MPVHSGQPVVSMNGFPRTECQPSPVLTDERGIGVAGPRVCASIYIDRASSSLGGSVDFVGALLARSRVAIRP